MGFTEIQAEAIERSRWIVDGLGDRKNVGSKEQSDLWTPAWAAFLVASTEIGSSRWMKRIRMKKKMNEKNNVMKRIRGWIWTVNCLGSI